MLRKLLCSGLLFVLLLAFSPAMCFSQQMYRITEAELTMLENSLSRQESIITQLLSEVKLLKLSENESQKQLQVALSELGQMKKELLVLRMDLENSRQSLMKANQYLQEYEQEMKSKTKTIKNQRNFAWFVAAGAAVCALKN